MATTQLADLIVPEVYDAYMQQEVLTKTNILESGAFTADAHLGNLLSGGGSVFNMPLWNLLDETNTNVATDNPNDIITPKKVTATSIIVPRAVRTNAWQVANLDEIYTAEDPISYIVSRRAENQKILLQNQALAVVKGIFANNALATDSYHAQDDMRLDISGSSYSAGVTNFTGEALIDACATMGDYSDDLSLIIVHPIVYASMKKQQLIDTIQPAVVGAKPIPMYGNARIIVNSKVTTNGGKISTYIFGKDQFRIGFGSVADAVAFDVDQKAGNGMGITTLIYRWMNAIAPNGFSFVGTVPAGKGGVTDDATSNNYANANSWQRVVDREQVKMVELVTREA